MDQQLTSGSRKLDLSVQLFDSSILLLEFHFVVDIAFLELIDLLGELSDPLLELPHKLFLFVGLLGKLGPFVLHLFELE